MCVCVCVCIYICMYIYIYIYAIEYYSAIKNEILLFASTCVDLVLYLVKEDKDRYDITYIWNLKNAVNKYENQTHRHRKQTYGYQRGKVVGEGQIRNMGLTHMNYYI